MFTKVMIFIKLKECMVELVLMASIVLGKYNAGKSSFNHSLAMERFCTLRATDHEEAPIWNYFVW